MGTFGNSANILKNKSAVAALRMGGNQLKLAHAIRHLGDAYRQAGQASLAESCYVEALSIYRNQEDRGPLDFANAIRSFAVLRDEGGATQEAQQLWKEAHDLYILVNVPAGIAETAARLALLACSQGNFSLSREWITKSVAAANVADDSETRQYVNKVKAEVESKIADQLK